MIISSTAPTLSSALAALGYAHRPTTAAEDPTRSARWVTRDGADVYLGTWYQVWAWLTRTGQVTWADVPPRSVLELLEMEAG